MMLVGKNMSNMINCIMSSFEQWPLREQVTGPYGLCERLCKETSTVFMIPNTYLSWISFTWVGAVN